ncbi:MFS transporter [Klenkia brasiliensis]|uniref:Predicted arabinose efflux permease, MFS family n=1 Tax=Klenkia brasiliensis TaxID=333142 RepID=A0A1G7UGS3_9ACTN|nr:MFS transporter [Klenkia brasiliensis]SDG46694.1 Predicted arabinose efflux permease, MFS family [Klenkia brasiliensis]
MGQDRPATYRSVFAEAEFRPLFGSYVLATAGDMLAKLALTVLVYERTGSPLLSALTFAISYLPWVVGGPLLAALADRLPRKQVMVASDLARAALVALMAVPGMPLAALLVLLLLVSVCSPPYEAARSALTADVLTDDRYAVATSLVGVVQQLAQVVGFLVGGLLVTALSPSLGLLLNALAFALAGLWLVVGLRPRPAPDPGADGPVSLGADVAAGLRLVLTTPRLLAIVGLLWVGTLVTNAHEGIGPALSDQLVGSQALVGVLLAAHPVGSVVGSVVVGRFCPPRLRERLVVPLVVLSVGALALAGLAVRVLTGDAAVVAFVSLLAVAGFGTAWLIPLNVAFVRAVPPALRGRAFGVAVAGLSAVQGLGALLAGGAATGVAPTDVVLLVGLLGVPAVAVPLVGLLRTRPPATSPVAGPSGA